MPARREHSETTIIVEEAAQIGSPYSPSNAAQSAAEHWAPPLETTNRTKRIVGALIKKINSAAKKFGHGIRRTLRGGRRRGGGGGGSRSSGGRRRMRPNRRNMKRRPMMGPYDQRMMNGMQQNGGGRKPMKWKRMKGRNRQQNNPVSKDGVHHDEPVTESGTATTMPTPPAETTPPPAETTPGTRSKSVDGGGQDVEGDEEEMGMDDEMDWQPEGFYPEMHHDGMGPPPMHQAQPPYQQQHPSSQNPHHFTQSHPNTNFPPQHSHPQPHSGHNSHPDQEPPNSGQTNNNGIQQHRPLPGHDNNFHPQPQHPPASHRNNNFHPPTPHRAPSHNGQSNRFHPYQRPSHSGQHQGSNHLEPSGGGPPASSSFPHANHRPIPSRSTALHPQHHPVGTLPPAHQFQSSPNHPSHPSSHLRGVGQFGSRQDSHHHETEKESEDKGEEKTKEDDKTNEVEEMNVGAHRHGTIRVPTHHRGGGEGEVPEGLAQHLTAGLMAGALGGVHQPAREEYHNRSGGENGADDDKTNEVEHGTHGLGTGLGGGAHFGGHPQLRHPSQAPPHVGGGLGSHPSHHQMHGHSWPNHPNPQQNANSGHEGSGSGEEMDKEHGPEHDGQEYGQEHGLGPGSGLGTIGNGGLGHLPSSLHHSATMPNGEDPEKHPVGEKKASSEESHEDGEKKEGEHKEEEGEGPPHPPVAHHGLGMSPNGQLGDMGSFPPPAGHHLGLGAGQQHDGPMGQKAGSHSSESSESQTEEGQQNDEAVHGLGGVHPTNGLGGEGGGGLGAAPHNALGAPHHGLGMLSPHQTGGGLGGPPHHIDHHNDHGESGEESAVHGLGGIHPTNGQGLGGEGGLGATPHNALSAPHHGLGIPSLHGGGLGGPPHHNDHDHGESGEEESGETVEEAPDEQHQPGLGTIGAAGGPLGIGLPQRSATIGNGANSPKHDHDPMASRMASSDEALHQHSPGWHGHGHVGHGFGLGAGAGHQHPQMQHHDGRSGQESSEEGEKGMGPHQLGGGINQIGAPPRAATSFGHGLGDGLGHGAGHGTIGQTPTAFGAPNSQHGFGHAGNLPMGRGIGPPGLRTIGTGGLGGTNLMNGQQHPGPISGLGIGQHHRPSLGNGQLHNNLPSPGPLQNGIGPPGLGTIGSNPLHPSHHPLANQRQPPSTAHPAGHHSQGHHPGMIHNGGPTAGQFSHHHIHPEPVVEEGGGGTGEHEGPWNGAKIGGKSESVEETPIAMAPPGAHHQRGEEDQHKLAGNLVNSAQEELESVRSKLRSAMTLLGPAKQEQAQQIQHHPNPWDPPHNTPPVHGGFHANPPPNSAMPTAINSQQGGGLGGGAHHLPTSAAVPADQQGHQNVLQQPHSQSHYVPPLHNQNVPPHPNAALHHALSNALQRMKDALNQSPPSMPAAATNIAQQGGATGHATHTHLPTNSGTIGGSQQHHPPQQQQQQQPALQSFPAPSGPQQSHANTANTPSFSHHHHPPPPATTSNGTPASFPPLANPVNTSNHLSNPAMPTATQRGYGGGGGHHVPIPAAMPSDQRDHNLQQPRHNHLHDALRNSLYRMANPTTNPEMPMSTNFQQGGGDGGGNNLPIPAAIPSGQPTVQQGQQHPTHLGQTHNPILRQFHQTTNPEMSTASNLQRGGGGGAQHSQIPATGQPPLQQGQQQASFPAHHRNSHRNPPIHSNPSSFPSPLSQPPLHHLGGQTIPNPHQNHQKHPIGTTPTTNDQPMAQPQRMPLPHHRTMERRPRLAKTPQSILRRPGGWGNSFQVPTSPLRSGNWPQPSNILNRPPMMVPPVS